MTHPRFSYLKKWKTCWCKHLPNCTFDVWQLAPESGKVPNCMGGNPSPNARIACKNNLNCVSNPYATIALKSKIKVYRRLQKAFRMCTLDALQRPKKSEPSGWQNSMHKNFAYGVCKSIFATNRVSRSFSRQKVHTFVIWSPSQKLSRLSVNSPDYP